LPMSNTSAGSAANADGHVSPFERIKHTDEDGEFWSARELSKVLEYALWQKFKNVIERAREICMLMQQDASFHFALENMSVTIGKGAEREIVDYRLTKYAVYLILLCSDVKKPEVVQALAYVAVEQLATNAFSQSKLDYIPHIGNIALTKEQKTIGQITKAFKHWTALEHFRVSPYYVDLYFPDQKIVVECDEWGHLHYDQNAERERQHYIEETLKCTFIRYNPDDRDFNIGNVINTLIRLVYT
ncbi:MAG TPA: BRO family protein, partial [Ktedonobacterales bacterium]